MTDPWDDITPASSGTVLAVEPDPFPSDRRSCPTCGAALDEDEIPCDVEE
jgi:hypothetical protein